MAFITKDVSMLMDLIRRELKPIINKIVEDETEVAVKLIRGRIEAEVDKLAVTVAHNLSAEEFGSEIRIIVAREV